jgi:hypothetical protein
MQLVCPRCGTKGNELIECDNCGAIGCIRCMRKRYGNWVCHKCEVPEREYHYPEEREEKISDAFSAMFG